MSDQYPSRDLDKVIIRLPDGMKDRIRRAADEHGRSVNAELVLLLDRTYPAEATLDECVQEIVSIIEQRPEQDRSAAWELVFEKLSAARFSQERDKG